MEVFWILLRLRSEPGQCRFLLVSIKVWKPISGEGFSGLCQRGFAKRGLEEMVKNLWSCQARRVFPDLLRMAERLAQALKTRIHGIYAA